MTHSHLPRPVYTACRLTCSHVLQPTVYCIALFVPETCASFGLQTVQGIQSNTFQAALLLGNIEGHLVSMIA